MPATCMTKSWLLPKVGSWSFIFGFCIAVVSAFFGSSDAIVSVLVMLGIIVGLLNITGEKAITFLLTTAAMVVISSMGTPVTASVFGGLFGRMLNNLIIFIIPASMIVGLRAILTLAYKK